jgi:hypothetical protein
MEQKEVEVPLSTEDKNNEIVMAKMKEFDQQLATALGNRIEGIQVADDVDEYELYEDDTHPPRLIPDADDIDLDTDTNFISAKVKVPYGDHAVTGRVIYRKRDSDGNLIGRSHSDSLKSTAIYDVEFDDGRVEAFSANMIAGNMFEQIDSDGNIQQLLDEIIDHKKSSDAVSGDMLENKRIRKQQEVGNCVFAGEMALSAGKD